MFTRIELNKKNKEYILLIEFVTLFMPMEIVVIRYVGAACVCIVGVCTTWCH